MKKKINLGDIPKNQGNLDKSKAPLARVENKKVSITDKN